MAGREPRSRRRSGGSREVDHGRQCGSGRRERPSGIRRHDVQRLRLARRRARARGARGLRDLAAGSSRRTARRARRLAVRRRRAHLRRRGLRARRALHAAAQRGGDPAALRRLQGHDARAGAARHEPVLHAKEDLAPRAQPQRRAAQGQRQARQPDRDRRGRRLARRRHGEGVLRRRRLRELREAAGRSRRAPPRVVVRLRRGRQPPRPHARADAARERRHRRQGARRASCRRASTRPASSSRRRGSRTSPTRRRSRR